MSNLANLPPMGLKDRSEKPVKPRKPIPRVSAKKAANRQSEQGQEGAQFMADVHLVPCQVCAKFGLKQTSLTEAHHPISGRYSTERAPDSKVVALCRCHHQGLRHDRDKSKLAIHQGKASWEARYGPDTDYIKPTRVAVEVMRETIDF